jgi:hypothetical protein
MTKLLTAPLQIKKCIPLKIPSYSCGKETGCSWRLNGTLRLLLGLEKSSTVMPRLRVRRLPEGTFELLLNLTNRHVHAQLVDRHAGRVVVAVHSNQEVGQSLPFAHNSFLRFVVHLNSCIQLSTNAEVCITDLFFCVYKYIYLGGPSGYSWSG